MAAAAEVMTTPAEAAAPQVEDEEAKTESLESDREDLLKELAKEECPAEKPKGYHFDCDFEELPDGTMIWNASRVLLQYLQAPERASKLRGRRVLELGSGLGHLGHGLALLGAHVTCTEQLKCLPELEASLKELDRHEGSPSTAGGSVTALELSWGEEGLAASPSMQAATAGGVAPFDFIISAEIVYLEETHDLLLWTWERFCAPQTVIYSVFINRPFSWNFFVKLHDLGVFEVDQIEDFDPCGLDPEETHMHRVTRKPAAAA